MIDAQQREYLIREASEGRFYTDIIGMTDDMRTALEMLYYGAIATGDAVDVFEGRKRFIGSVAAPELATA